MQKGRGVGFALITVVMTGALTSACGGGGTTSEEASEYLRHHLLARGSAASRNVWYRTIAELLPNARYAAPGQTPRAIIDAAVVGRVVKVSKGYGFSVPGDDAASGKRIDFDNRRARWKTFHLTVAVDRALGRGTDVGERISVGVALDGSANFEKVERGYKGLGTLVLFLYKGSPVFDYGASLYALVEDGTLVVVVGEDGRFSIPTVEPERESALLRNTPTLDALERRADEAPYTIPLRREGNQEYRSTE